MTTSTEWIPTHRNSPCWFKTECTNKTYLGKCKSECDSYEIYENLRAELKQKRGTTLMEEYKYGRKS